MMPSMNGEELVKAIKESDSLGHIPVIVLCAKGQVNSKLDMYSIGADNYLTKPFQLQELIAVGTNTLKQRQRLRDKFIEEFLNNQLSIILEMILTLKLVRLQICNSI